MRAGVPVPLNLSVLDENLHVALMRQDCQVGVETRGDLAGLGAGPFVRLLELNLAASLALPAGRESGNQAVVNHLANNRVGADLEGVGRRNIPRLTARKRDRRQKCQERTT